LQVTRLRDVCQVAVRLYLHMPVYTCDTRETCDTCGSCTVTAHDAHQALRAAPMHMKHFACASPHDHNHMETTSVILTASTWCLMDVTAPLQWHLHACDLLLPPLVHV
jgi:23S rRNA G2445 N2-methylase RlmL